MTIRTVKRDRLRYERSLPPAGEPWVWFSREILESDAWRLLPGNSKMVVFRICIEHMSHAGTANGNLKVTWIDFEQYGIRKMSLKAAIDKAVEHGFITITRQGRRSVGPSKLPTHFALTWQALEDATAPTNRWKAWQPPTPHTQTINSSSGNASRANGRNPTGPTSENATGLGSENATGFEQKRYQGKKRSATSSQLRREREVG